MSYRYMRYPGGKYKAVTLSYDDCTQFNCKFAERLNKTTLKCTFNLNSNGFADGAFKPSKEQVRKLIIDFEHEIAVHGQKHLASGIVSPLEGIRDVLLCREQLEEIFEIIVRGMAYPDSGIRRFHNGHTYETVRQYLQSLGIVYARTLGADNDEFMLPSDFYAWIPTAHHGNPALFDYIQRFLNIDISTLNHTEHYPRLFYLWGHAYEFEFHQSWELLDKICDTLGGHDDIWYATNMQIFEYVKGYESLVWNAKYDRVYNPNLFPVWFAVNLEVYCVNPGETLKIS